MNLVVLSYIDNKNFSNTISNSHEVAILAGSDAAPEYFIGLNSLYKTGRINVIKVQIPLLSSRDNSPGVTQKR